MNAGRLEDLNIGTLERLRWTTTTKFTKDYTKITKYNQIAAGHGLRVVLGARSSLEFD